MVLLMVVGVAIAMPFGVLAQDNPIGKISDVGAGVGEVNISTGAVLNADTLVTIITTLVNWFAWVIALASVVMGLYAGFLFITARGGSIADLNGAPDASVGGHRHCGCGHFVQHYHINQNNF